MISVDFYEIQWINKCKGRHLIYCNAKATKITDTVEIVTFKVVTVEEISNDIKLVDLLLIDDDPRLLTENLLVKKNNLPIQNHGLSNETDTIFEDTEEKPKIKEESKDHVKVDESFTITFEDSAIDSKKIKVESKEELTVECDPHVAVDENFTMFFEDFVAPKIELKEEIIGQEKVDEDFTMTFEDYTKPKLFDENVTTKIEVKNEDDCNFS